MSSNRHTLNVIDEFEIFKNVSGSENEISYLNEVKANDLETIVANELTRKSANKQWIWKLFLLCVAPNILNGFHVSSYIFIGQMPNDHWCIIPELYEANWTDNHIRTISSTISDELGNGCQILNWNYNQLSKMTYDEALGYIKTLPKPNTVSCKKYPGAYQKYQQEEGVTSIVPDWDLVCENSVWRTTVQVAISIGKFLGATTFGIISDKFGRRTSCSIGAGLHILGGILTTFSPWYWLFLLGRFSLGASSSGLFYAGFTLCSENISVQARSWISVLYSMAYPIGMLYLALAANFLHDWRNLQLSLTVPAFLLILYCFFLTESPRWLISKNRYAAAYKILFKKKFNGSKIELEEKVIDAENQPLSSTFEKFKNAFVELSSLYGPAKYRRMAIICHFTWFATSLSYYVTAINADNLSANRVVYVAATGGVDIASIIASMILLRFVGRKLSIFILYLLSSACLLILLAISRDESNWLVTVAMLARFGITAVYAVVTLHTAEMFPTDIRNSALGTSSMCGHIGSTAAPYIVDFMGLIAWYIPTTICGILILLAALLTLTHPETRTSNLKDKVKSDS